MAKPLRLMSTGEIKTTIHQLNERIKLLSEELDRRKTQQNAEVIKKAMEEIHPYDENYYRELNGLKPIKKD